MDKKLKLFSLTWPIVVELFLFMLIGNVDVFMLSHYSDNAVAAVGVSNQLLNMIFIMFAMITTGTGVLISQYLGAGKKKKVIEIAVLSIFVNLSVGVFFSFLLFVFGKDLLTFMKLPPNLMEDAIKYLEIAGSFAFIQALLLTISTVIKNYGFTKITMFVTLGMNLLHIIINYLFLFGPFGLPVLGVSGTAISSSISRFTALIILFLFFIKKVEPKFSLKYIFPFPMTALKKLLRIGIPIAGEQLSYNTSQIVITCFIAMIGANEITARVYAMNISSFIFLFPIAMGQATQIIVGHKVGAGEKDEAYKVCLSNFKKAIIVSFTISVVFALFGKDIFSIFTKDHSIISIGSTILMLSILLETGRTFNLVIIAGLRAAGDVKFPVVMGIVSMWGVSVVLSYILGIHFKLGLPGMWIAFAVDEWLRGIIMYLRWKSRIWENKSFVTNPLRS